MILHGVGEPLFLQRDGVEPDDGVHGRPDLVGHAGEKFRLGERGLFGGGQRGGHLLPVVLLLFKDLGHVGQKHHDDGPIFVQVEAFIFQAAARAAGHRLVAVAPGIVKSVGRLGLQFLQNVPERILLPQHSFFARVRGHFDPAFDGGHVVLSRENTVAAVAGVAAVEGLRGQIIEGERQVVFTDDILADLAVERFIVNIARVEKRDQVA